MKTLKELVRQERLPEARKRLRELAVTTGAHAEYNALCRVHAHLSEKEETAEGQRQLRIALLGVGTTEMVAPALSLALDTRMIQAEIRTANYGTYAHEMLDPESDTAKFQPHIAVVVNSPVNLPARPHSLSKSAEVDAAVGDAVDYWLDLCEGLNANAGCEIILDNLHPSPLRPLGNLGAKTSWDTNTFIRQFNLELGGRAPRYLHISDIATLAAQLGLNRWFDPRLWFHAKLPVALECLPAYVKNTARIVAAIEGRSAKCLVLDLDNTLWGGVIGDDGIGGIRLGQGNAEGEAYLAFQRYVLDLKERGVLLAVSSKNDEANALAPFDSHPEMLIQREDIVAFKANWEPKPDNLRAIAEELNIGLDALVFVDDNLRERDIVRQWAPEVRVVEMSEDISDYPRLLDETGWFEPVRLSAEDRVKTEQYRSNRARADSERSVGDYDAYLRGLAQVAVIAPYESAHLDRISQLINKSNQFNLTTRRQTRAEVAGEMDDPDRVTAYVRLADRFGDNGLISVFSSQVDGKGLEIDQWLMSCRVFNRGVEQLLLNWVIEQAEALGLEEIRGTFKPTAKNSLVADHYESMGFDSMDDDSVDPGTTRWRLALQGFSPPAVNIDLVKEY